jgi:hypothetical protein
MTCGETLIVIAASILGSLFAGVLSTSFGATPLSVGLSALIGFDVIGGAVCNGTRTTRAWYHRPGQTWVQHAEFVAPHLAYVVVVAGFLRGPTFDLRYALVFGLGLVLAAAAILSAPERLRTPVAFCCYLVLLYTVTISVGSTAAMGWFEPTLMLKLLLGHLIPDSTRSKSAA